MMKRIVTLLLACVVLSGCANPSYVKKVDNFNPVNWQKIVVLPFSGSEEFADEATSVFAMQLIEQNDFEILEPSAIQDAIDQVVINKNDKGGITVAEAQRIGQLTNVKAVFLGNVNSYNNGATLNGFATVKLIDTDTGKIVAAVHKPSGLLIAYSEHQCVIDAVERTAKEMLKVLKDLAAKNRTS